MSRFSIVTGGRSLPVSKAGIERLVLPYSEARIESFRLGVGLTAFKTSHEPLNRTEMQTSNQKRVAKLELAERQRLFSEYGAALDLLTMDELQEFVTFTGGPDFSEMSDEELEEIANAETILPSLRDMRRDISLFEEWQTAKNTQITAEGGR